MARLLINPNTPGAWEVQLRPGINLLGRGFANDFKIENGTVSSSHCQILVEGGKAILKDLGSTNGTFVNRQPVSEAILQPGQIIHLGSVEMIFQGDVAPARPTSQTEIIPRASIPAPVVPGQVAAAPVSMGGAPPIPVVRAGSGFPIASPVPTGRASGPPVAVPLTPPATATSIVPRHVMAGVPGVAPAAITAIPGTQPSALAVPVPRPVPVSAPAPVSLPPPPIPTVHGHARVSAPPPVVAAGPAPLASGGNCKFHPKTIGRYFCNTCHGYFCELCVASRTTGAVAGKFCRHCGTQLIPIQVKVQAPGKVSFFRRIPSVFIYPFKGSGLFILIFSTIAISGLDFLRKYGIFYKITLTVVFYGYLFAFMQGIIHTTASEDEELPSWPSFDDLGSGFLNLMGAVLLSFGFAIALFAWAVINDESGAGIAMIPAMIFGCLYFPMALLAVAMKDTPLAANPLIVIPAVFKAPLEYLVTVVLMAIVLGMRYGGQMLVDFIFANSFYTKSMGELLAMFAASALWAFVAVYFLAVNMRLLGILYVTKKNELGWFSHS